MKRSILFLVCMVAVITARPQSTVIYDLEPGQTEGLRIYIGPVTGAFSIPNRTYVEPGQTDQVAWAPTSGNEPRTGQPYSSPFTGTTAMLFGDGMIGGNKGEGASFSFTVDRPNMAFIISTMLIMQDPGHGDRSNPYGDYKLLDAANREIDCGSFSIVSAGNKGWNMVPSGFTAKELKRMGEKTADPNAFVFFRPWTAAMVSLKDHVGSRMTLNVSFGDCSVKNGTHGAMALCDIQLVELAIEQKGTLSCEDAAGVQLYGPDGAINYEWTGPDGFTSNEQNPTVDAAGTYTLRMSVETGSKCGVELSVVVAGAAERAASNGITTSGTLNCDSDSGVVLTAEANMNGYEWSTGETTQSITVHEPGEYTVSRPGAPGRKCDQEDHVNIVADLSLPDPAFTLSAADICEGMSVDITATPIPAELQKKVKQRYDFGDGSVVEEEVNAHTFTLPGTYVVTHHLERGQCSVPYQQTINVHPNPVPSLGIGVECDVERTYTFSPLGAGPNDEVWFTGTRCNGQEFAHESIGIAYRAPLPADSCVTFSMKIRTPLGCEGSAQEPFTAPYDPVLWLKLEQTGEPGDNRVRVIDRSEHVVARGWEHAGAQVYMNDSTGIPDSLYYPSCGHHRVVLHAEGAPYSCPATIAKGIDLAEPLKRFVVEVVPPVPLPVERFTPRNCCGMSPRKDCQCNCCTRNPKN